MKYTVIVLLLASSFDSLCQIKIPKKDEVLKDIRSLERPKSKDENQEPKASAAAIPAEETQSPAKAQINAFWKQIEKMQNHNKPENQQVVYSSGLQSARMSLKNTKMKDPSYDTSEMEKALAACQEVYDGLGGAKQNLRDTRAQTIAQSEILLTKPFVFTKAEINIGGQNVDNRAFVEEKLAESNLVIEDYKNQVANFLGSNPEKKMYENEILSVRNHIKSSDILLAKAEDVYKNYRSLGSVQAYQNLIIRKVYIEQMQKVFPEETGFASFLQKINDALKNYGSAANFMDKMAKNQKEYIKNIRMAKAVVSDPTLEKIAKQSYEKADMSDQTYTVTKVNLVSQWKLEKNELGIPLHKEMYVNMAIKLGNGKCGIAVGWLHATYEGGNYGSPQLYNASSIQELPCENL